MKKCKIESCQKKVCDLEISEFAHYQGFCLEHFNQSIKPKITKSKEEIYA